MDEAPGLAKMTISIEGKFFVSRKLSRNIRLIRFLSCAFAIALLDKAIPILA